jgi:hypothetical protein
MNGASGPSSRRVRRHARWRARSSCSRSRPSRGSPSSRSRRPAGRGGAAKPPLREVGADPASGGQLSVKEGRFGLYVTDGETNASLRGGESVETLTLDRAVELLAERRAKGPAAKPRAAACALLTQNVYKASHNVNGPPAKLWARARQPSGPDGILPAETPFGLLGKARSRGSFSGSTRKYPLESEPTSDTRR